MFKRPILTLNPSRFRAARYRRQAMSALRANSSLSVRLKRYNQAMEKARALESKTADVCRFKQNTTKPCRETMHRAILLTLQNARPVGANENIVLNIIQVMYSNTTILEVRCELERLSGAGLIEVDKSSSGHWFAALTSGGLAVVERHTFLCSLAAQGGAQ